MRHYRIFQKNGTVAVVEIPGLASVNLVKNGTLTLSSIGTQDDNYRFVKWEDLIAVNEVDPDQLCQSCGIRDKARGFDECYPCLAEQEK